MILSKKQISLYKDIISPDIPNISVLGSTQSGKTYDICFSLIEYARALNEYEKEQRLNKEYIPRDYNGAIIGWTTDTIKSNIVDNLLNILEKEYKFTNGKEFTLKYGMMDKYLEIYGIKFYFFGFNNKLSFNKILGKPLIFVWCDESARIYTQGQLRESFDEIPGRQMSYAGHPFYKRIDSYNVEGSQSHPYKKEYIDKRDWKQYVFYPYDNPVLDTEEKVKEAIKTFPVGSLREQKVFNKWVVAEGKVFNHITKITQEEFEKNYVIREIGIGCDYGSVNATTFSAVALAQNQITRQWNLVLLDKYYHDPKTEGDTPTTEYYSNQLKQFINYLHKKYLNIPVNTLVIDSEASHFSNRLEVDGIRHELAKKNNISVDKSVQLMQSLFYKDFLVILESPHIRYFINNEPVYGGHDIGLEELESYHYDKLKSEKEGINCYVKDFDHYVDGTRYLIMEFSLTGRCPIV
jgi:PBSX family phage terminase large subunit